MVKLLLVIGAVVAVTISRTDGAIILPINKIIVVPGRNIGIVCTVTGESFVAWVTPAKPAAGIPSERIPVSQTQGRRSISVSGNTYLLTILDATVNDGGDYICEGSVNRAIFTLEVDFSTANVEAKQQLHLGRPGSIKLDVSSYPLPTYEWKKDGQVLTFPIRGKTLDPNTGSINITNVQLSDEGNYTCRITLGVHEDVEIEVTVIGTVASSPAISPTPSSSVIMATSMPVVPNVGTVASSLVPTPSSAAIVTTSMPVATQPPIIGCGGMLNGSSGSFASPGYPVSYTNNLNCLWTLSIPASGFLTLQFIVFETESCCDFVELTDIFGGRINRISGSRSGFSVTVRGDRTTLLRVRFTTDSSVRGQGFLAQYSVTFITVTSSLALSPTPSSSAIFATSTPAVPNVTVTSSLAISPTPSSSVIVATSTPVVPNGCGGSFTGLSGSFASPGYPVSYTNNLNCLWTLSIPANGSLRLQFNVFETESCCDFVELTDIFGARIDRISGTRSGFSVTVRGDRTRLLRVRFTTDSSVTRQGFLAQYSITFATVTSVSSLAPTPASSAIVATSSPVLATQPPIIGCGGDLPGSSASFASPGYPVSYSNLLNCLWTLRIPANGFLRLQFIVFETERGFDFVELTDSSGQRIERLDGSRSGFAIIVGGNRTTLLNIRLTTDGSVVRQGFLAQYTITVVQPSATSLPPVMSSSAVPPVTIPPDVQRVLVDLLRSLCQIIQRLQELLRGSFSPSDFENFRNQTLQILQQVENQLISPNSSQLRSFQIAKRSIPELSTPQEMVEMLENIQRKLLD